MSNDDDRWMMHPSREVREAFLAGQYSMRGMRGVLADVRAFHEITDSPVYAVPMIPYPERVQLRRTLIREEILETQKAADRKDLVEVADGFADVTYVIVGSMLEAGIPAEVWDEVQRSNMAKKDPVTGKVRRREDGKILKPEGWTPPDIRGVLLKHGWKGGVKS